MMASRRSSIIEADLMRAIRGVLKGGVVIGHVEVDCRIGRILIYAVGAAPDNEDVNPCDRLLQ
jgi:hypothetical protein